ncbi:MAG: 30S ribosomal protein S19 [Candidatus Micrarchaeaceae archaeon]
MPRQFLFRGKTLEELKGMSIEEFMGLLKSRQRRSLKRMTKEYKRLIEKVRKSKENGKVVKTKLREAVIIPEWVDSRIAVHNGKEYKEIAITPDMLGHRLGDFAFTVKRVVHSAPGIRATKGSKNIAVK